MSKKQGEDRKEGGAESEGEGELMMEDMEACDSVLYDVAYSSV